MKKKTKKILVKRFRKTKNNKVLHKIKGVSHFMAKKTSNSRNKVKGNKILEKSAGKKLQSDL
jgi:ribosomal protein L35